MPSKKLQITITTSPIYKEKSLQVALYGAFYAGYNLKVLSTFLKHKTVTAESVTFSFVFKNSCQLKSVVVTIFGNIVFNGKEIEI